MFRVRIFFCIFLIIMLFGCSVDIVRRINKEIFLEAQMLVLIKENAPEIYHVIIKGDDLELLKKEMKQISNIIEYESNINQPDGFKAGFHAMSVYIGQNTITIMYSLEKGSIIVRKCDVFPGQSIDNLPNIKAYEFTITRNATELLRKYENMLPKDGYFYDMLPPP